MIIYSSDNFIVESCDRPHIDRADGGHIIISPKVKLVNRQELTPKQAIELMRLTMVVGQAMKEVMNKNGVDIGRINYSDAGNWSVFKPGGSFLHIHLYGRAKSARIQKYGQALNFPHKDDYPEFYAKLKPLSKKDVQEIRLEIGRLLKTKKYKDSVWGLAK